MTKSNEMRGELALLTDKISRQMDDLERSQIDTSGDVALAIEQIEQATSHLGEEWHNLHIRHCTAVASILSRLANSTNAKLIQTGIVDPPDSVKSIAAKCTPDLSRLEMRKK